jgi:hypothetical protein
VACGCGQREARSGGHSFLGEVDAGMRAPGTKIK